MSNLSDTDQSKSPSGSTKLLSKSPTPNNKANQLSKIQSNVQNNEIMYDDSLKQQLFNKRTRLNNTYSNYNLTKTNLNIQHQSSNGAFKINSDFDKIGNQIVKNDDSLSKYTDK